MTRYQSPSNFPDEHMRLLGLIAAHWETVEMILGRLVAEAMDHEYRRVGILTENVSFHPLCDILMIYARPLEESRPEIWAEFTAMLKDVKDAYSARNRYIHAVWLYHEQEMRRSEVRTKNGKLIATDEPTTADELAKAAEQIWDAGERLCRFGRSCGLLR